MLIVVALGFVRGSLCRHCMCLETFLSAFRVTSGLPAQQELLRLNIMHAIR